MNFIATARLIISLLPVIIDAVKAVEAALPAGGSGAQKLELVKSTLSHVFESSTDIVGKFDTYWPILQKVIGSVVEYFNKTGAFKK